MKKWSENANIFDILKDIKRKENYKMLHMSREEKIRYIVEQMEEIERRLPEMVINTDDENTDQFTR